MWGGLFWLSPTLNDCNFRSIKSNELRIKQLLLNIFWEYFSVVPGIFIVFLLRLLDETSIVRKFH